MNISIEHTLTIAYWYHWEWYQCEFEYCKESGKCQIPCWGVVVLKASNYTMSPKNVHLLFLITLSEINQFNDIWHVKSWENLTWKSYRLSTSPVRCSHCTLGNPKVIFNSIIHTYLWLYTLFHKKTICNPHAHPTWNCHHTNLWNTNAKLFHLTEGSLHSFKHWELWEPVVDCHRWLSKEPVVMCGNWNVRQVVSQQVFRVTTFCINTCFQSFSTRFGCIVHHAVLKFCPCRNKPLPGSTCLYQYTRSSCSVPQMQYYCYADNKEL